jgi:hypothetical protein
MSAFMETCLREIGWRLGLQAITGITKAVNREDKRSRRYRDRHFANLKGLVAIDIATAVSLAGVETAIWFSVTQPRREREPDR